EARFAVLALSSASGTAPFDAALRRYVEFLTADGELEVELEIDRRVSLAPDEQIEVFRIVQEGLANVRKHAGARRVEVVIGERGGALACDRDEARLELELERRPLEARLHRLCRPAEQDRTAAGGRARQRPEVVLAEAEPLRDPQRQRRVVGPGVEKTRQ